MEAKIRRLSGGIAFGMRVTPRGGRDAIEGWAVGSDGRHHLKARVRSAPEDGKANTALIGLVAGALDVPKSAVKIAGGQSSRLKMIEVTGDAALLSVRIEALGRSGKAS